MSAPDLSSVLEECITQLQQGATLEQVLERYPQYAVELRSLLETATWMKDARKGITPSKDAQIRSRISFINRAYQPEARPGFFQSLHLRLATTIIIALIAFGLVGTTLTSAQSLPGDVLYPVKLAFEQVQLNFAGGPQQRMQLQEDFDQRRAEEVDRLKQAGRRTVVSFSGVLTQNSGQWQVAGITLDLSGQQTAQAAGWENLVVQVSGELDGMTVHVTDITPRVLTFDGTLQKKDEHTWLVDGVQVFLNENTQIEASAPVGSLLSVTARRDADGNIVAVTIKVLETPAATQGENSTSEVEEPQPVASATQPVETESRPEGEHPSPTSVAPTPLPTQPDSSATPRSDGGEHKPPTSTDTPAIAPSATPTQTPSHNGDGDGHRTRTVPPRWTPTQTPSTQTPTPTSTMTPTPTGTQTGQPPEENNPPSRTPTPTPTRID